VAPRTTIKLPAVYRDLAPVAGRIAIEHAALDCRIHETFLALALSISGDVAFFTDSLERIQASLDRWLEGERVRKRRFAAGRLFRYRVGATVLWVVTPAATVRDFIFRDLTAVFMTDAHAFESDLLKVVDRRGPTGRSRLRGLYIAGQFVGRDRWFYRFCHDRHAYRKWATAPRLRRLDCDAVARAFPDQAERILPKDDPRYAWSMRLRDPLPNEHTAPILSFARRRLKIRSDLRPEDMSDAQRAELERALAGARWTKGTSVTLSLEFGAVQRRILALKRLGRARGFRKFIVVKYRRAGVTVLSQAEAYYHCLARPRSYVAFVAHLDETIQRLFSTVTTFAEMDPFSPGLKGKPTANTIRFQNGSYCFIGTGKSEGLLRGDTIQYFHGSEVPYWLRGARALASMNLLMAGIEESARHGEIVLEGTPKGREWFCVKYQEAKAKQNDYWPIFLPWFHDPTCRLLPGEFNEVEVRDTLTTEERGLIERYELGLDQVAFRRAKRRQYGALFLQEFPEDDQTCFISAGSMYFPPEIVSELAQTVPDSVPRKEIPGGYEIRWEEPQKDVQYVAGCDTSEGIAGGDRNGVGILRRDTWAQVATVHGLFSPRELAEHAVRLCREYNEALLGVERENHGHLVIDRIEALGYGLPHTQGGTLYYHADGKDDGKRRLGKKGWSTNERTREQIIGDLRAALVDGSMVVRDRDFISEMMTFCRQSNGRWDHDSGAYDDTIFKWGIALQMTKHEPLRPTIIFVDRGL